MSNIDYQDDATTLEGFLVDNKKEHGVILCHAWRGRDDFVCEKAKEIASWGYTTFALDVYGKGVLGKTKEENQALMAPFMQDRKMLQKRLLAGFNFFKEKTKVKKITVMGFCFGGLCALDLARTINFDSAISIHGLLKSPTYPTLSTIQTKILALHGYLDPMVTMDDVNHFSKEMSSKKADFQVHIYGQAYHAFTNPIANDPSFGTVYNKTAADRAWETIKSFLE